jgi:hypothetical protein
MTKSEIIEIMGPEVDVLLGSVLQVSPDEIKKAETCVKDIAQSLEDKLEKECRHLSMVDDLRVHLDRIHELVEQQPDNTVLFALALILKEEKNWHQDQASRQHVNQQEERLEEAKQRLRLLKMKHELAAAITGAV